MCSYCLRFKLLCWIEVNNLVSTANRWNSPFAFSSAAYHIQINNTSTREECQYIDCGVDEKHPKVKKMYMFYVHVSQEKGSKQSVTTTAPAEWLQSHSLVEDPQSICQMLCLFHIHIFTELLGWYIHFVHKFSSLSNSALWQIIGLVPWNAKKATAILVGSETPYLGFLWIGCLLKHSDMLRKLFKKSFIFHTLVCLPRKPIICLFS